MAVTVTQDVFDFINEQKRFWQDRAEQEANNRDTAEQNRKAFQKKSETFDRVLLDLEVGP